MPALEAIEYARATSVILAFHGVLNGTTNFVLDQLARGEELQNAIHAAQRVGYAEASPKLDVDGTDAAQKLILLARAAFGISLPLAKISRRGIEHLSAEALHEVRKRGCTIRLVASCRANAADVEARVAPVELPIDHPFARLKGAENGLIIETESGTRPIVCGAGAGRWPTTEAVIADLFAILCELSADESISKELEEVVA